MKFGCAQTPRTTPIGSAPIWIAENPVTRTAYSVNLEDSSISVIDALNRNATDTAYATSQNNGTVTVLNGAARNAFVTIGCRDYAPTTPVGNGPQPIALDPLEVAPSMSLARW